MKTKNRSKTRIKFLDRDDITKMIGAAQNPLEQALMETLFSTGLRVTECVSLPRAGIDGAETKELSIVGKGGWQRVVFFSPPALEAITDYAAQRTDSDPRLFPISKRTAERVVARAAAHVGLKATPHTFRHSLATHLLKQGANIRIVQEMLGHRSLSSTMVYTGVANKDLLEAHKKFL